MAFEPDLFISYARLDDQPLMSGQTGWISNFHKVLAIRLAMLRGEEPKIWRDEATLQGNDYLTPAIMKALTEARLLVSVLSPRYLKSEWCMEELTRFCQTAQNRGGVRVGGSKARLFKVVKTYLPLKEHPQEFTELLGYDFFEFDEAKRPKEFDSTYGPELGQKFLNKLDDLAYDIHQTLTLLEAKVEPAVTHLSPGAEPTTGPTSTPKTIYLAETTDDLTETRDKVRRELEMAGHRVLPVQQLPLSADFAQCVQTHLAQCDLSVHLVSPQPTEGSESPSEQVRQQLMAARSQEQLEIAERCGQARQTMPQMVWMPPTVQLGEGDGFLKALQNRTDFLSTPLEVLKTLIADRLAPPAPLPLLTDGDRQRVYLDCDQRDLEEQDIEPLYNWLDARFEVVLPDHVSLDHMSPDHGSPDAGGSLSRSEALLRQCEAVIIFYGRAKDLWFKRRLSALKKTLYDRPQPLMAQAVYLAGPTTASKQRLMGSGLTVIDGRQRFDPQQMASFLAAFGGQA